MIKTLKLRLDLGLSLVYIVHLTGHKYENLEVQYNLTDSIHFWSIVMKPSSVYNSSWKFGLQDCNMNTDLK